MAEVQGNGPELHTPLLRALLDATVEPVWILGPQGQVLAANAAATDGAGQAGQAPALASGSAQAALEMALRTGERQVFEDISAHSAVEYTVTRIQDRPQPLVLVRARDLSALRSAMEAVRQERQRFQYLLESLDGPVIVVGQDLLVRYCNRACRKLLGNIVGTYCAGLDCLQPAEELLPLRLNITRPASWEWRHQDRYFLMSSAPMTDADGDTVSIIHGVDITRRTQAELNLARNQRQMLAIVTYAQEGIVVLCEGKVVFANPFMVSLLGQPPEMLIGQPFRPLIHPDDRARVLEIHAHRLAGREVPFSYDCRLLHAASGVRWVQVAAALLEWEGRQAVLAMLTDITERKSMEQMLHDLLQEQDRIIFEKTASLVQANKSLRQSMEEQRRISRRLEVANRKAVDAARAKSLFLANMGHEIRTPLNVILGMTQVALRDNPADSSRRPLEMIRESGSQLLAVINDLLDFSKIEAHRLSLETIPFSLSALLRGIVESFAPTAAERGLDLRLDIQPDVPDTVAGDPARIAQVLNNLLSNALKFTTAGFVRLAVRRSRKPRPDTKGNAPLPSGRNPLHLLCCVQDTGPGIPADKIQHIFKRFQQVDDSISRRYGGTGLGLTISRRLARLMWGDVWVRSVEGQGSRFYFSARLEALDACILSEEQLLRQHGQPAVVPLTILLAEDSPQNAEMLQALLAPYGHHLVHVANGQLALDALRNPAAHGVPAFDLVLMDVQMPVLDGMSATRQLRSGLDPALPREIPVIALTAHSMEQEVRAIMQAGATRHVAKPVDVRVLLRTIAEVQQGAVAAPRPALPAVAEGAASQAGITPWQPEREAALARLGGSEPLLQRLTDVFLQQSPATAQMARQAWEAGDLATLAEHAHALKGNASAIGAQPMAHAAAALEAAARQAASGQEDRQPLLPLLEQLEAALAACAAGNATS
ncbi:PAS domain-containing hybrid sensor histidine kinase/response regulator [Megalodesulfovibrio paquesii]